MGVIGQDIVLWRGIYKIINYSEFGSLKKVFYIYRGRKFLNDWGIEMVKKKKK